MGTVGGMTDMKQLALPSRIGNALADFGIQWDFRHDRRAVWNDTLSKAGYIPVAYSASSIDYQFAYQHGNSGKWWDISLILYFDNRPCALWPLSYSIKNDTSSISAHGLPILPPLFVQECPVKSRKTVTKACLGFLEEFCLTDGIKKMESAESYNETIGLSIWHEESMRCGASSALKYELFVDLTPDIAAIKSRFRKSYKALINSGARLWSVELMEDQNQAIWDEFRMLHLKVSGRETRSAETWMLQHEAISNREAFLIYLCDDYGKMVGGGFFSITCNEGVYGVGVYDRSLFDKPLGHVVQFRAIEEMKNRGLRWYKIGLRPYSAEFPVPTKKELSIGMFKQGFASHLFPQHRLTHKIGSD